MASPTYTNLINKGMELYGEGRYWEGYLLITGMADRFPRIEAQVYDLRASLACQAGHPELGLDLLSEAVMQKGCWFSQDYLLGDEDIRPVRSLPGFQALREICFARERKAKEESASDMALIKGSGGARSPMIIALHGHWQNLDIAREDWRVGGEQPWDMAFVRSSQIAFSEGYVWNDLERGLTDLVTEVNRLRSTGMLDDRETILAGFSAGARLALHAVLRDLIKVEGMILVGPWLPEIDEWLDLVSLLKDRIKGACIICGQLDEDCLRSSIRLYDAFRETGLLSELVLIEGIGHDFPDDFREMLPHTVDVALGKR